jgi:hypothetical protein
MGPTIREKAKSAASAAKPLISHETAKEKVWKSLEFPWKSLEFPWKGFEFPWNSLEKFGAAPRVANTLSLALSRGAGEGTQRRSPALAATRPSG